jgi:hypothetical protein
MGLVVLNATSDDLTPAVFSIEATYSFGEKAFSETTTINLRPNSDGMLPAPADVEELKRIREQLEQIAAVLAAGANPP